MEREQRPRGDDLKRAADATLTKGDAGRSSLGDCARALRARREELRGRLADAREVTVDLLRQVIADLQATEEEVLRADEAAREKSERMSSVRHELEAEVARHRDHFMRSPDPTVITDASGVVREANAAATSLFQLPPQLVAGRALFAFMAGPEAGAIRRALADLENGGVVRTVRLHVRRRNDGPAIPIVMNATAAREGTGVIRDVRWTLRELGAIPGAEEVARLEAIVARQAKLIDELAARSSSSTEAAEVSPSTFDVADLADLTGIRVLVVEDDAEAREVLSSVIADCGAIVFEAEGASEALALVERERPDVLVSDIGLPGRDGYELLRAVRALGADRGGDVPAIALTGYAAIEDSRDALRAGYQVHVAKPIDPALLTHAVANVAGVPIVDMLR